MISHAAGLRCDHFYREREIDLCNFKTFNPKYSALKNNIFSVIFCSLKTEFGRSIEKYSDRGYLLGRFRPEPVIIMMRIRRYYFGKLRKSPGPGNQLCLYEAQYIPVPRMSCLSRPGNLLQIPDILSNPFFNQTQRQS